MTSDGTPNASAASSMSVLSSNEGSSVSGAALVVFFFAAGMAPRLLNSCTQTPYGRGEPSGSGVSSDTLRIQPWRQSEA